MIENEGNKETVIAAIRAMQAELTNQRPNDTCPTLFDLDIPEFDAVIAAGLNAALDAEYKAKNHDEMLPWCFASAAYFVLTDSYLEPEEIAPHSSGGWALFYLARKITLFHQLINSVESKHKKKRKKKARAKR